MKIHFILVTLVLLGLFSCVPLKQFQELQQSEKDCMAAQRRLEAEVQDLEVDNDELKADIERMKKALAMLEKDTLRLAKQNWSLKNRNKELLSKYNSFLENSSLKNRSGESAELLAHLQSLHEQLQKREDALLLAERELADKQHSLEVASSELDVMQDELARRNRRLTELERALSEKDSMMNALRNTVANALTDFGSDELEVHIKNGKVYVSMEEKLLFGSGSYQVSAIGVGALKKIAGVLEQKPDINVLVEGHTDDVPYKSGVLLDNWDLSVKRATSVTRILLQNAHIEPSRITAAGRSEFVPIDEAKTPEARRKNRRTEIILSPNLNQVFDILETN
ncbi:OmpA family protein [Saccharicrinis fermentans]|uniref:Root adhesin n=1 Tax=Saccharicrinis fermentans DSM 9555 = JCM 21142 TaxID=869213 RepID=W7YKC5_9BACT|nr:OmpA family protein [Saccharicrinis fermentans]GAF02799.1 root adhesin [Saccharicrinis fermentans DSM 9555 = JCM 21142]